MMRSPQSKRWFASVVVPVLSLALVSPALAATASAAQSGSGAEPTEQFVDGIAAVVNKQVITLRQVENAAQAAEAQLRRQNIQVPSREILRRQVLQQLITEELLRQEAERLNIQVNDAQVQQAVRTIAERNRITPERLRQEIEKTGASWEDYLSDLRREVRLEQLRQRAVDSHIIITDAEVDAFLKSSQGRSGLASGPQGAPAPQSQAQAPAQQAVTGNIGLAQILVAVPEGAPPARVQELRQKAESILQQLRGGADFASVAAASSDGPEALEGGDMGVRPMQGWPDLFLEAIRNLQQGEISDIVQSGNGFHILKVTARAGASAPAQAPAAPQPGFGSGPQPGQSQGPMLVTQTHARHILIKVNQAMTEERALERLSQLRQRIEMGEDFEALARRYSEDASAPQGGDLGWLTPGETVPPFEQAMNNLEPGQVSQPVQTPFGWHLIQVIERRTKDMEEEFRRMEARRVLFQRRAEPAFEDWLSQLRGQAYIDNRLDPESSRRPALR